MILVFCWGCVRGRVNKILQDISKPYDKYLESCLLNQKYPSSLDITPGIFFLGLNDPLM